MSKPTKKTDAKHLKHYYGIAKICFYIMVFNIVVRLDLWVSIAGMIVLLPYLLQKLLLKKLDSAKYLNLFNHYFNAIKKVHQEPKIIQTQENTHTPAQTIEPTQSETNDFAESSFEAIWQDCQQVEFIWDEVVYYQSPYQENNDRN
ncbi:hypothetical protein A9G29_05280 [Gilliamella sp. Fer2-1]|jgi:hypothetical protein|nr:hypothetical protein A9G29_05280 [Gilliamella apicola]